MKYPIIATTIALALSCISGVGAAQDESQQTTRLQRVTVTAVPGQYETYAINLNTGYGLKTLVGHTHRQYVQAQREAERSEALRKRGMAPSPFVTVAIDNSSGPGMARRILLLDANRATVAVVDAHCKRVVPVEGKRCQLVSRDASSQSLASREMGRLHLAEVDQH
ncbi:hypothetical protein ASG75_09855 [Rhodanobacter sp. Soil772]|uniref:hypothetical protein n=1 Tax=Rhodanobacter sp. Soil772 TaxID=1736406 RepID=UPI0007017C6D|nr:hypothetical protein [Rhodanobacter sp. Soil772]KRE85850.1 hypothetical protein ASG75_09855 [Rhodanobacter sp. Soil772]